MIRRYWLLSVAMTALFACSASAADTKVQPIAKDDCCKAGAACCLEGKPCCKEKACCATDKACCKTGTAACCLDAAKAKAATNGRAACRERV